MCSLLLVKMRLTCAGVGLGLVLDINTLEYIDEELPIFDGVLLSVAYTHDPTNFERIHLTPGTWSRVNLRMRRTQLFDTRTKGVKQYCSDNTESFRLMNCS